MLARTVTSIALALTVPALLAPAPVAAAETSPAVTVEAAPRLAADVVSGVAGKVSGPRAPLSAARVYLYRLSDLSLVQAVTDERGHFLFDALPAGLYKVIAHKAGFVPAVVQLTRTTASAFQFLELELSASTATDRSDGEDFWTVRSQVPTDVLRRIQLAEIQDATRQAGSTAGASVAPAALARAGNFAGQMRATTGVEEIGAAAGQLTRGELGVQGQVGTVKLGVSGDYLQLQPGFGDTEGPSGFARTLSLSMASEDNTTVRLSSRNDRLLASPESRQDIDFENYRLAVSHDLGERGRSDFLAQYTAESNFHRHGWMDPQTIPEESRSWRLEGTYTTELGDRSSLQTGVRYRERSSAFGFAGDAGLLAPEQQRVDVFGNAGLQVQPSVVVEYGLYSTMRDGSLSLSPRGGLVLQLSPLWQASAAASYKVHDENARDADYFIPSLRGADDLDDACEQNDGHCYQVVLTHQSGDDNSLSLGATQREFDETQRMYFSDQFIDRYDSLYLVPGDEMPEVQFAVSRRLSPSVVTRLQSNMAEGGGGVFYATDSEAYENQVRYLVTSLDTHFDGTSTGLFIAFHHLEQSLQAIEDDGRPAPQLEVERLELMLTQNLNVLLDMATDMALQLNMQVSRGSWPFLSEASQADREELRKRLVGGIALRF